MTKADLYTKETIHNILENGYRDENPRPKYSDGTPAHTLSINHVCHTFDISKGEFPITTLRPIAVQNAIKEVLWIYQKQSNSLQVLEKEFGIKWWREWESKKEQGTIGQRYGATIRKYDQLNQLLKGIIENPYGRRHIMSLWQINDFAETDGLMPCAFLTNFNVRGECLDMVLFQRSSDYLVAGHINAMQYVALLMMVSKHCGYKPGIFTHFMANVQIYDRHIANAKEMLRRTGAPTTPKLLFKTEKNNFYDFSYTDFVLEDYDPVNPQLKFELGI